MTTPRAVIYTRVSTDEQVEGTSLETQAFQCLRKATELTAQVMGTHSDEGVSGSFYASRPGIQKALTDIEAGRANVLIVYSISRLSRDTEHQQAIKKRIERAGARLVICDMPMEDTAEGELMFGISGTFAQYERKVIRKRTMDGRRRKAEQGQQPSRNRPPFGYHIVTKEDVLKGDYAHSLLGLYQVVPEQARIVREIFVRYASGQSLRQIAKWLHATGVEPQWGGKEWYVSTVKYMLNNPAYKGGPVFGRRQWHTDERRIEQGLNPGYSRLSPVEDQVILTSEGIVDVGIWEQCQERLSENKETQSAPWEKRNMLSGLMRCQTCDRTMTSDKAKGVLYYHCVQNRPSRTVTGHVCTKKMHRGDVVEAIVLRDLCFLANRPERFRDALNTYQRKTTAAQQSPEEVNRLQSDLAELDRQETATAKAQINALTSGRSADVYDRLLTEIDGKRRALKARLAAAHPLPSTTAQDNTTQGEQIAEVLRRVNEVLSASELTPPEKQAVLSTIIRAVRPEGDGYVLDLRSSSSASAGSAQVAERVQMISIH